MIDDVRLFRFAEALATHGSFSRAASSLSVTQPTLSRGIQELEAQTGVQLFLRSHARTELTDFGRVFMEHASEILSRVNQLKQEVERASGTQTREVTLAFGTYAVEVLAAQVAIGLIQRAGIRPRIINAEPASATRLLRERKVDLIVVEQSLVTAEDIEILDVLAPITGYVYVRVGHPLLSVPDLQLTDIVRYPFAQVVALPARVLQHVLAAREAEGGDYSKLPFPAANLPSMTCALQMVATSDAIAFGNTRVMGLEIKVGEIVPLAFSAPWLHAQWAIMHLREKPRDTVTEVIVDVIRAAHARVLD